jgi:hypothetical protein
VQQQLLAEVVRRDDDPKQYPPCERHHMGKHTAGWKVRRNPDGTTTWTSPQGRQYTTRPPERWTLPDGRMIVR